MVFRLRLCRRFPQFQPMASGPFGMTTRVDLKGIDEFLIALELDSFQTSWIQMQKAPSFRHILYPLTLWQFRMCRTLAVQSEEVAFSHPEISSVVPKTTIGIPPLTIARDDGNAPHPDGGVVVVVEAASFFHHLAKSQKWHTKQWNPRHTPMNRRSILSKPKQ